MTDCIGPLYFKNETALLWPIRQGTVYDKIRQDNDVTDYTSAVYVKIRTELSWLIGQVTIYHKI